ncbi:hypothetical protein DL89DRAFT_265068 [Linderina pennispora]|uniref:Aminoglycoside phosphotransferase domain-containing protein n=1 Tax=Linderina pennispora TaxID=61395 RepID=A0A1Y1WHS6_9FUNG|nr:uncharacterized protein DL89DRAFT_265068 [Linderina pennispora]ORX72888.1 hypothetical protein DL89DRAFT_265068 [Linderina pennispora]
MPGSPQQRTAQRRNSSWAGLVTHAVKSLAAGWKRMVEMPFTLAHNDLEPRNILINKGKIVCVIDWENAEFYPPYCESSPGSLAARHRKYPRCSHRIRRTTARWSTLS